MQTWLDIFNIVFLSLSQFVMLIIFFQLASKASERSNDVQVEETNANENSIWQEEN